MRRLALLAGGLVLLGALTALFVAVGHHVVPMNSDNATLVLEGQSMRSGDISLSGWALALDSFWTTEAPVYALGLWLGIGSATMLYLGPAIVASLAVGVAAWIARGSGSLPQRIVGPVLVLALLALPAPGLSFYLLQGGWHVGTALLVLIAFGGLGTRSRWGAVLAGVALTLALLGDLQTLAFGVAPIFLCALLAVVRERRVGETAVRLAVVGVAAPLLALGLHHLAEALGSYAVLNANPTPNLSHELANVARIPAREAGLAGAVALPVHTATGGPTLARVLHGVGFGLVMLSVAVALIGLSVGLLRGSREARPPSDWWATVTLDDLLLAALCGDLADFIVLSGTGNGNYARYLTASVLFAAALAGRALSRVTRRLSGSELLRLVAVVGLFSAASIGAFAESFSLPAAAEEPLPLGSFLTAHHLTSGVGDYWSSSIVTVETNGAVGVRPVITAPSGHLVRYGRSSTSAWYAGAHFDFVVFDTAHPWRGVDAATTLATFGRPNAVDSVGSYRIFVYRSSFTVSPRGYSRS